MQGGRLDRRITIQQATRSTSAAGAVTNTWAPLSHRRPAGYRPLRGEERFGGDQYAAREQVEFTVRYTAAIAGLTPSDRIIYPAPDDQNVQRPTLSTIYQILAVHELGRREGLRIVTVRFHGGSA